MKQSEKYEMDHVYQIKEVRDGIWHIDEGGLASAYIVRGDDRGLVIDTGTGVSSLKGLVEQYLTVPYDVVLTHGHVDHAGGISQFEQVYINNRDIEMADGITLKNREDYISSMYQVKSTLIKPDQIIPELRTDAKPEYLPVQSGDVFRLGGRELEVAECPGHTLGSICLIDRADRIIFTGDSMNDLELICAPAENRMGLLRQWYESANKILSDCGETELCCGGHTVFAPEKAKEIIECGKKVLNHEIEMERMKIHIFIGNFAKYKNSCITVDEVLERI